MYCMYGGSAHISRGFSAAVTRHDQLKAAAAEELSSQAEARSRNNGLSSAYDSVYHAPDGDADPRELDRQRRMKVTRKGTVRMMSKKEAAKEDALLASLR